MVELQQSPPYAAYLHAVGWNSFRVDNVNIFHRNLPLVGTMAKIQRPPQLPYLPKLIPELRSINCHLLVAEAAADTEPNEFLAWRRSLSKFFRFDKTLYLATKTIIVDLTPEETTIFSRFTEAKRRAVRRAAKNGIQISRSEDLNLLSSTKASAAGMFGSITTYGLDKLSQSFGPKNTSILLAYAPKERKPVGGIFLVFWDSRAYYWIAGATKTGKSLFAPTLLVWEAIRESKRHGATSFDFIGAWDERIPQENTSWKGFTKFKEGFGGTTVYYPLPRP